MTVRTMPVGVEGQIFWRDDAGYEATRQTASWNERKPHRFPDVIVVAATEHDVVAAVRFARAQRMQVAVKSGGHNLSGACLRDGGMLIDLSRLDGLSIDASSRTATVQPAVTSRVLAEALADSQLAFPVGHCGSVPMGGYLLSGGLGWNMGRWGLACLSVEEMQVVTGDGEVVTANEQANGDLFWAARGAGSGFFGAVIGFRIRVQPLPKAIRSSAYLYPLADVEEVSAWARDIVPTLPASVEMLMNLVTAPPGAPAGPAGKAVAVTATAFADSDQSAAESLAILESCPAISRALFRQENEPNTFAGLHDSLDLRLPPRHRYMEDALWTSADYATVLPRLAEHIVGAPSPKSLVMAVMPPPAPPGAHLPDMAFSMRGTTFVLCYAVWDDPDDDARNESWHHQMVESIAPMTIGRYIAEGDLSRSASAASAFAPPNWEKLQAFKKELDPDNVFHTYLG